MQHKQRILKPCVVPDDLRRSYYELSYQYAPAAPQSDEYLLSMKLYSVQWNFSLKNFIFFAKKEGMANIRKRSAWLKEWISLYYNLQCGTQNIYTPAHTKEITYVYFHLFNAKFYFHHLTFRILAKNICFYYEFNILRSVTKEVNKNVPKLSRILTTFYSFCDLQLQEIL